MMKNMDLPNDLNNGVIYKGELFMHKNRIRMIVVIAFSLICYISYTYLAFTHIEKLTEVELNYLCLAGKNYELDTGKRLSSLEQLLEEQVIVGKTFGPWIKNVRRNSSNEIVDFWGVPYQFDVNTQTIRSTGYEQQPIVFSIWRLLGNDVERLSRTTITSTGNIQNMN